MGRQIINISIMSAAVFVFLIGELFSGSNLVNSQELPANVLKNQIEIIPEKNTALTEIPESRKRIEYFAYTVQGGDTLLGIGNNFKISIDALKYVNGLYDDSILRVGQEILIPPTSGLIHKVESGDTLVSIAKKYSVPSQAIADFNYILDTSKLSLNQELVIPDAKIPVLPSAVLQVFPSSISQGVEDKNAEKDWCIWPASTRIISQEFSWYHNGLDIAAPWGKPMPNLIACAGGRVVRSGWDPFGLGLHIIIDHGNGYETVYGHMGRLDVSYGDKIGRGEVIGVLGNTGRSTGPHVHFMVKYKGTPQNPLNYIQ